MGTSPPSREQEPCRQTSRQEPCRTTLGLCPVTTRGPTTVPSYRPRTTRGRATSPCPDDPAAPGQASSLQETRLLRPSLSGIPSTTVWGPELEQAAAVMLISTSLLIMRCLKVLMEVRDQDSRLCHLFVHQ